MTFEKQPFEPYFFIVECHLFNRSVVTETAAEGVTPRGTRQSADSDEKKSDDFDENASLGKKSINPRICLKYNASVCLWEFNGIDRIYNLKKEIAPVMLFCKITQFVNNLFRTCSQR